MSAKPSRTSCRRPRSDWCRKKSNESRAVNSLPYTELYLRGKWVKATPAFDRTLCDRFGVRTLEFDGLEDSLMHPYNRNGRRHMEYLRDRGPQVDVPVREIIATFAREYPGFGKNAAETAATQFRDEAARERERRLKRQVPVS